MDPTTIWKEACSHSGYSFWPQLEEAEICFNFKNKDIASRKKDKAETLEWVKKHPCTKCAFFGMNGFCSSFLTLDQWAELQSTPIYDSERMHKWDAFREKNTAK
jgi:hypothetical protein